MARTLSQEFKLQGLVLDIPPSELPPDVYTLAQNMVPVDNGMQRISGYENRFATSLLDAPRHLQSAITELQNYFVYVGDTIIGVTDGTSHFDITPNAAPLTSISNVRDWTSDLINNLVVLNNNSDMPMYWDGATANRVLPLPNWLDSGNARAQSIRTFGTYLFALGIEDSSGTRLNEVAWSDEAPVGSVPATWVPASSNDAGNQELSETRGVLIDAARLRNALVIYKDFSTYLCEFVGGNEVFGFRLLYEDVGCLGVNCVAEARNLHYVMSRDDIYVHDGVNRPRPLSDQRIRRFYQQNLNEAEAPASYVVNNIADQEIWFCFPEIGETVPNIALIYNVVTDNWGIREIRFNHIVNGIIAPPPVNFTYDTTTDTYDTTTLTYNQNITGTGELELLAADENNTSLVAVDTAETDRGSNITSLLRRTGLDFGEPEREKLITAIYPRITATAGTVIQIRVGSQNGPELAINWGPYQNFTVGTDDKVDADVMGREIAIEFLNNGDTVWKVDSFLAAYQVRGRHAV